MYKNANFHRSVRNSLCLLYTKRLNQGKNQTYVSFGILQGKINKFHIFFSVVSGNDGCLFCFGHANLGKSRSMVGSDESSKSMGVIPIALAWLYRAIKEKKAR